MYIRTNYLSRIHTAYTSTKTVLLVGARQVGKTTLIQQYFSTYTHPQSVSINCEQRPTRPFSTHKQMKERFLLEHKINILNEGIVALDEIQARDEAELYIKTRHDDPDIRCKLLATGSRFIGQVRAGSTLVGRGTQIQVFPFSLAEHIHATANIEDITTLSYESLIGLLQEHLTYGGYPAVIFEPSVEKKIMTLKDLVSSRIQKDIGYFLDNKHSGVFFKALQHVTLNTGNIYKEHPLCAHIGLSKSVIQPMIQFLLHSYVGHRISPFYSDKTQEFNKASELFLYDTGRMNTLRSHRQTDMLHDGKIIETYVATSCARLPYTTLYYYKKKTGTEIDFVLETMHGSLIPIEVKSSDKGLIPKSFAGFFKKYGDRISYGIVTTQSKEEIKKLGDYDIHFIPFWKLEEAVVSLHTTHTPPHTSHTPLA